MSEARDKLAVWIFQSGEPLHIDAGDSRPMRGMNLANALAARGHRVLWWSADFDHIGKTHRQRAGEDIRVSDNLRIRLLPSPGYKRNIGPGRLWDHARLAFELNRALKREPARPDVVFAGFPPIEAAWVMVRWSRAHGVPVLLDVKDQWPSIFIWALPRALQPLGRVLFWPWARLARSAMRDATALGAMAQGFLDWTLEYSGRRRAPADGVFPLTSASDQVNARDLKAAQDWWRDNGLAGASTRRLCFVGSFNSAFDFEPVRAAAATALQRGDDWQFVLCGDGSHFDAVRTAFDHLPNVIFPGWIDRPRIEALAGQCIASLAPYRNEPNFIHNIPNKIIDSLSLGLPILSPLRGEVAALIERHAVGMRYASSDAPGAVSLYDVIKSLAGERERQKTMSRNARELYNARFLFSRVYDDLVARLEELADSAKAAAHGHENR